jgi:alginate O-acetyltransferase complex protein AlgJ
VENLLSHRNATRTTPPATCEQVAIRDYSTLYSSDAETLGPKFLALSLFSILIMDTTIAPTRTKSWLTYLPGLFLLLFLAVGAAFMLVSPGMFKSPQKPIWNGQWSAAYEAYLNKGLGFRQFAIDSWGVLDYTLFKEGREGVLVGRDGWLFTSEEFKFYPDGDTGIQEKLELASLAKQGASLVVVVIPSKARVYEEELGRYTFPGYNRDLYDSFAEALVTRGIPVVKLVGPLEEAKKEQAVFLKTDTHWTPYGAEVAAKTIATVVREQNVLPSMNSSTFTTAAKETSTPHKGDLLNYLPLGSLQERLGPPFDKLIEQTTMSDGSSGGLFGSSTIPVTLVGTSYSANPLWNFEGALKAALGTDVLNVANQGEGPVVPMRDYLASEALKDAPPELVIWEIPERFIRKSY